LRAEFGTRSRSLTGDRWGQPNKCSPAAIQWRPVHQRGPPRLPREADIRPPAAARQQRTRGGSEPEDLRAYVLLLDGCQKVPLDVGVPTVPQADWIAPPADTVARFPPADALARLSARAIASPAHQGPPDQTRSGPTSRQKRGADVAFSGALHDQGEQDLRGPATLGARRGTSTWMVFTRSRARTPSAPPDHPD
jgi:hypothetical protein